MATKRSNAPKRAIKRRVCRLNHNMGTSPVDVVIHTLSRKETLVRTIYDVSVRAAGAAVSEIWEVLLDKRPKAVQVATAANATGGEGDIGDIPIEEILRLRGGNGKGSDIGDDGFERIYRDVKSQRKFDASDTYVFSDDASAATLNVQGLIITFWKET